MRGLGVTAVALALALPQALAAQPLAPGKPAGVREARHGASTGLLIAGGVLVAGLVAVLAFNKGDNNSGVVTPTATTS